MSVSPSYVALPTTGPLSSALGHALITMAETTTEASDRYTQFYEGDHFVPVAMSSPWFFAGRRWEGSPGYTAQQGLAATASAGRWFLGVYLIVEGRLDDAKSWIMSATNRANDEGRSFADRTPLMTGFADFVGSRRKPDFPTDEYALMDPTKALSVEVVIDRDGQGAGWLLDRAESVVRDVESVSAVHIFGDQTPDGEARFTLLWFLDSDAEAHAPSTAEVERMEAAGYPVQVLAALTPRRMGVAAAG
ncbi:hypothetical protein MRBLWH7_001210 [Microbacterium sp. LWH7-1.2]|uniref:hypothetical protein n=1 Tax=Microbacterium sp. LWH7-1.2 TaxID=3135257 RepID=UPI00313A251B